MTKRNLFLIATCLTVGLSLGGVAKAQTIKDVNVTNDTPNPVPVVIQNGTNTPQVKELVEIVVLDFNNSVFNPQPPLDVYTVPAGKRLVITDVIIGGTSGPHTIFRDGTIVSRVNMAKTVPQYNHSYVSGIEFQENQIVSIQAQPTNQYLSDYELRGYQTDIN